MALQRDTKYPGRFTASSTAQPQGAFKNRTSTTAKDGSYLEQDWANDWSAFFSSLLYNAGVSPDGSVDEVGASQYYDAMLAVLKPAETQVITSSGTYTPTAGARAIKVTLVGGGGGAGGIDGQGDGTAAISTAGAEGGKCEIIISTLESSYSIIIGAGGTGGAAGNNNGATGGNSTFIGNDTATTSLTANGGSGGTGQIGTSGNARTVGASGGSSSGGDINTNGVDSSSSTVIGGVRGSESLSGGGIKGANDSNGTNGANYGQGGGSTTAYLTTTNYAGGDGYQGVCIIEEFF